MSDGKAQVRAIQRVAAARDALAVADAARDAAEAQLLGAVYDAAAAGVPNKELAVVTRHSVRWVERTRKTIAAARS